MEQYLGRSIDELSEDLGVGPEITYEEEGENGYPESALFKIKEDVYVQGKLSTDPFLADIIHDPTMYIGDSIWRTVIIWLQLLKA
jgi:hypothetical protein